MKITKTSLLYFLIIFAVGVATGGVLGVAMAKRQITRALHFPTIAQRVKTELAAKLDLDAAQIEKINPMVDRSVEKVRGIYADTLKQIDGVLLEGQKSLVADLRPDQIAKLKTIAKNRDDFVRKHNPLETDAGK